MAVRRGQQIVHHSDRGDTDGDRGASRHAGFEDVVRRVELLDGDERYGITGEYRSIGTVAVEQSGGVDAEADPHCERQEHQIARLREQADNDDGRRAADNRCDQAKAGLLQGASAGRLGQDRDRDSRRGGRLELEPEARGQGDDDGEPDADPESPRASRNSGKAQWRVDRGGRHEERALALSARVVEESAFRVGSANERPDCSSRAHLRPASRSPARFGPKTPIDGTAPAETAASLLVIMVIAHFALIAAAIRCD